MPRAQQLPAGLSVLGSGAVIWDRSAQTVAQAGPPFPQVAQSIYNNEPGTTSGLAKSLAAIGLHPVSISIAPNPWAPAWCVFSGVFSTFRRARAVRGSYPRPLRC